MADAKKVKEVKKTELTAEVAVVEEPKAEKPAAKAGKRSAKAQNEAEEKETKQTRKASGDQAESKPKVASNPPRSKLERAGKKYREAAQQVDRAKTYSLDEAIALAVKTSPVKFDASVELHVRLGIDPKQADQNVRSTVVLPSGTGKTIKIAVLTEDDKEGILPKLDKEQIDFDTLITTPAMMPKLAKYARLLGPRGLMPSPKSGTVTADLDKAIEEAKAGKVEFRADQAGIVHLGIGKISLGEAKLSANGSAVATAIKTAKPSSIKGIYIRSAFVSSTMGPSIPVTL